MTKGRLEEGFLVCQFELRVPLKNANELLAGQNSQKLSFQVEAVSENVFRFVTLPNVGQAGIKESGPIDEKIWGSIFKDRTWSWSVSAPQILETNGSLSDDRRTAFYSVSLSELLFGNRAEGFYVLVQTDSGWWSRFINFFSSSDGSPNESAFIRFTKKLFILISKAMGQRAFGEWLELDSQAEKRRLEAEAQEKRRLEAEAQEKRRLEAEAQEKRRQQAELQQRIRLEAESRLNRPDGVDQPGSSPSQSKFEPSESYARKVADAVRPNIIFAGPVNVNAPAVIRVRLAASGIIIGRELLKSSGVSSWDGAVLRAIDRTGRMPLDTNGLVPATMDLVFRP
ncbi:MAG: TonB C-terminal domain-containing protein [Proteobacteria bacterium]|nr:TonB C-terminal domain-containing protein [Pseudomonadota bacterium]